MADGYEDNISEEEEALLRSHEANGDLPPAEDGDNSPSIEQVAAEAGAAPAAEPAAEPAPTGEAPPADTAATDEEKLRTFLEQHKGKSPDELLRLAFQQQQRANQAGFQARQSMQQIEGLRTRASAAMERAAARRAEIAQEREKFGQRLQDDPDGATKDLHERLLTREEQELQETERTARYDAAVGLAATAIPGFGERVGDTFQFGKELNYSDEELNNISDGRDLVTLYLASLTGRMIKSGLMDVHGNVLKIPEPVTDIPAGRMPTAAPVKTLGSAPARTSGGGSSVEQQLTDITKMTDAQLDEFEKKNPGALEALLRQAS